MTKKHFIKFAAEIKKHVQSPGYLNHAKWMAEMVAKIAAQDNPNFDRARFMAACGL